MVEAKQTEPVDFANLAKQEARRKAQEIEDNDYLDWSLCLLIDFTNFGFEQLIKQLDQAKKYNCAQAEGKIEKILREEYKENYKFHLKEQEPDNSSADGRSDN